MKKSLLILAMFIGAAASAQDMNSKRGTPILPEAGDWSIGIGANSTLEYFGNLMNGSNSAPSFDWPGSQNVIHGKMMKDENTAYRIGLRIGFNSGKTTEADPQEGELSETKTSAMDINLMGGIQKYRGKGRLRGFYGGEVGFGIGSGKTTMTYEGDAPAGSTLEDKQGGTFEFGIRGFIGAEYFFAPKMSVAGEFGWGIGLGSQGEGEQTIADGTGGSDSAKTGKSSSFSIDTDNGSPGGSIILNFYF
ncbi:MAG: hypothetical protein IPM91_05190 [Bacteroidetes bacterium]|nr:hypothetical protein [Bacteroidota bacterium]